MIVHFFLKYRTQFGQALVLVNTHSSGDEISEKRYELSYFNDEYWTLELNISPKKNEPFRYYYILRNADGVEVPEGENRRQISINKRKALNVYDTWNPMGEIKNVFQTSPFKNVFANRKKYNSSLPASFNIEFRVKAPMLQNDEVICMAGDTEELMQWSEVKPILLIEKEGWWTSKILMEESGEINYKYGIFNLHENKIVRWENGDNRHFQSPVNEDKILLLQDGFVNDSGVNWKGAGVSIPVFGLRSKNGLGVGEFADIKLLIDWAVTTGIRLVQLLPVNDTTAHHNWKDSYPYAAISAFALNPLYINLEKVAGKDHEGLIKQLRRKKRKLNQQGDVDYVEVMKVKWRALKEIYDATYDQLATNEAFNSFVTEHAEWLESYAAFSYLRDKYKTADFNRWKKHSVYDKKAIAKLISRTSTHYKGIAFYYFVQYHLHLQLKEISDYAHKKRVILKGDIPIGIYRYGGDAWVDPTLYNMDEQAGAPPDDFAVAGQNWGFPTYNWEKMKEDNFKWWHQRFGQMSQYFDAFRIDHILGFFRIWSIPLNAVEGILGRFVPAIPVYLEEFHQRGIWFDHDRYCKPYITNEIIHQKFGDRSEEIKNRFLEEEYGRWKLQHEWDSQLKIEQGLTEGEDQQLKQRLFDLVSNVILIEEPDSGGQRFHFRIGMNQTSSFQNLESQTQQQLQDLYVNYFYRRQDDFWRKEGLKKLPQLKRSTDMLVCGEDLGMVPDCVPQVMKDLGILSLEIERMPKATGTEFFHPKDAPYLSVITPSTHDMSTIREWWEEDRERTQHFYNHMLGHYGEAPYYCDDWICKEIIVQHMYSPAMWSIYQVQDLLGMSDNLRRENPREERINLPSNPNHHWKFRMHIPLENLLKESEFNASIKQYIVESGRSIQ